MSAQSPLPPELSELQAQLQGLVPAASTLSREALLFEAGFAAASANRRGQWLWPGISSALAAALVFVLATRPTTPVPGIGPPAVTQASDAQFADQSVEVRQEALGEDVQVRLVRRWYSSEAAPMLALREQALHGGWMPQSRGAQSGLPTAAPATNRRLLQEFLTSPTSIELGESS